MQAQTTNAAIHMVMDSDYSDYSDYSQCQVACLMHVAKFKGGKKLTNHLVIKFDSPSTKEEREKHPEINCIIQRSYILYE